MARQQVVEDIFEVTEKDPDGKKFDKVSRIVAKSDLYEMRMVLDVNTDIYPVEVGDKLSMCLASSLVPGSGPTGSGYEQLMSGRPSLMDQYEYVMHGRVFKYKGRDAQTADVYVSFGGLLMQLSGDPARLEDLDLDQGLYLLVRRVGL